MNDQGGGGASRSTDPASGSSAATDVSLREFLSAEIRALDRHMAAELNALRRETHGAHTAAEKATTIAADEARERLAAHNGLITKMEDLQDTFATRESVDDGRKGVEQRLSRVEAFQAKIVGGLMVVAAIGVANLVKVWT